MRVLIKYRSKGFWLRHSLNVTCLLSVDSIHPQTGFNRGVIRQDSSQSSQQGSCWWSGAHMAPRHLQSACWFITHRVKSVWWLQGFVPKRVGVRGPRGEFPPQPEYLQGEFLPNRSVRGVKFYPNQSITFSHKWPKREWLDMKISQISPKENGSKWKSDTLL